MTPAGLAAFERAARPSAPASTRTSGASRRSSTPSQERRFRADAAAWEWFQAQPPSYRRTALHWVMSAKQAETRERRLAS